VSGCPEYWTIQRKHKSALMHPRPRPTEIRTDGRTKIMATAQRFVSSDTSRAKNWKMKSMGACPIKGWTKLCKIDIFMYLFIHLLAQIEIHTIISNDNDYETVLTGQTGSTSTYRCRQ